MCDYNPQFPRSISGGKYRLPLTHPEVEALGHRADRAYREFPLAERERALLLKAYAGLSRVDRFFASAYEGRPLPPSSIRPPEPWSRGVILDRPHEIKAGYVERVRAYVEAIEQKYSLAAMPPALADDDI